MTILLRVVAVTLLAAATVFPQTITGSILGSVKDPGSLAVAGAEITLTHAATGAERKTVTDERGDFIFNGILPGEYVITARMSGFKTKEERGINLSASERLSAGDIVLEIGSLSDTVTVTAEGTFVQAASSERAGSITSDQVENLMVKGRNVMGLLETLPGVVDLADSESVDRNWNLAVNGNRRNSSGVSLNGMTLNQIGNNYNGAVSVSMDAVAEVKVLMSNYQAEYGRMSGANIQLVTKSGTRQFHGMGSYFKRHEQFNAMNFFDNRLGLRKSPYRYNTWSYNVGGPVILPGRLNRERNKLFFFWSQEYWPLKTPQGAKQLTVPSALEREGDFSRSLDLNGRMIAVTDPTGRTPFPGNIVPASRIDRSGQALLKVFPAANFFNTEISAYRYNYVFQSDRTSSQLMSTLKVDYNVNPANMLFVNMSLHADKQTGGMGLPTSGGTTWDQMIKTFSTHGKVFSGRYQRVISPSLVNEFTMGLSRRPEEDLYDPEELRRVQRDAVGFNVKNLSPASNPLNIIPNANFGGVTQPATLRTEGRFPLNQTQDTFTVTNHLTKVAGRHTVKGGFYADRIWRNSSRTVTFNGLVDFGRNANNPLETGYAYSNAITGVFNSYTEASARPYMHYRVSNIEWFLQDNWRVSRRLSIDFGMRFYLIPPLTERDRLVSGFQPANFNAARAAQLIRPAMAAGKRVGVDPVTGDIYPQVAIGALVPRGGDPANGMVVPARDGSYPPGLIENRGVHYGPRIGFAFDPFGKGRTAVRGGFGMFYNRQDLSSVQEPFSAQTPLVNNPIINFGTLSTLSESGGLLYPEDVLGLERAGHVPTVMNYSFGVQQQIGFKTVLDASYVGSLGRHLMWQRNLNAVPYGANFSPANADPTNPRTPLGPAFLRPLPGYGNVSFREWASSSNYHSLQVSANRRYARGVQFGASWTWSKAMDFNDTDTDGVAAFVPVRVWNYGLAAFDRTHIFKLNWLWDVPKLRTSLAPLKWALHGWQVSGITSFVSGSPLGINWGTTGAVDITGSPTEGARVVVVGNPVLPKSDRTFRRNFRTDVFRKPDVGTVGNAAKTLIRGPGINNWNTSFSKTFLAGRERLRLQFRAELYNALNHTQFSALDTSPRFDGQGNQVNARMGEFTAARNARQIQFALRAQF